MESTKDLADLGSAHVAASDGNIMSAIHATVYRKRLPVQVCLLDQSVYWNRPVRSFCGYRGRVPQ